MKDLKSKLSIENLLYFFVILCPILDIVSFGFRNIFHTNISPSTFLRPLIPMFVMIYLFIKKDSNFKIKSILVFGVFLTYSIIHVFLFSIGKTSSSYSNEIHEIQYLVNYSFMILNLFLFVYIFKDKNTEKLRIFVLISAIIYITSIYIAIVTNTSSYTYMEEQIGFKGWFESGNSICSILVLSMFIYLPLIKIKKYRIITSIVVFLNAVFLTMMVGTRVGLFGFIIVLAIYVSTEALYEILKHGKLNKKLIVLGLISLATIITVVITFGSATLERRQHLQDIEQNIVDDSLNTQSHITGDLLEIKQKIDNNILEEGYMSPAQKQSVVDLYNIANLWNVTNNDQRMQQLIYHVSLVKNQANPVLILFGNGYMTSFRELVFEMEVPAILFNFGILGFALFLMPFIGIIGYALYEGIKKYKRFEPEFARLFLGCGFAFALSFFSGYTFFNQSSALIIVLLSCLLLNHVKTEEKE